MKSISVLLLGLCLLSWPSWGQGPASTTLVQWNFNNSSRDANIGSGGLGLLGNVQFNTYASQAGAVGASSDPNPAGFSLETDNYAPQGMANKTTGLEIQLTTRGYKNIQLSFDLRHAASSSRRALIQYSINAQPFVDYQTYDIGGGDTWANKVFDFSALSVVNDITNLKFRIVSVFGDASNTVYLPAATNGTAYSTAGSWRFDMITIVGTPLNPLNAPTNLRAAAGSTANNIVLTWTDNSSNEDYFVLERSPDGNDPWTVLSATIPVNTTTYADNNPPNGNAHFYRIKAVNVGGESGYAQSVSALPVTYLSFVARYQNGAVVVTWETATEQDNAYFDVERSTDAKTYSAIGRVAGNGLSTSRQVYSLIDESPKPGWNYYRLKQVDTDGTFAYSRPVAVLNADTLAGTTLSLFPNPTSGPVTLDLNGNAAVAGVRVSSMKGQWVSLPVTDNVLNASTLPAGQYIVEIQTQDGRALRQRLVKE